MACDVGDSVLFTPRSVEVGAADVNRDGLVSPLDAVLVANAMHAGAAASGPTIAAAASDRFMLDVSGNGVIGGEDFDGIVSKLGDSRRQKTTEPTQLMSEEDPYVTVFISNADEGGVVLGGNDPGTLQVSLGLSQMLPYEVTVDFAILPLTATADEDFELLPGGMLTGTITFPAYQDTDEFTIYTIPDTTIEPDETLKVTLSNPVGATLHSQYYTATGTIYNDDFNTNPLAVDDGEDDVYWTLDATELYVNAAQGVLANDIDYQNDTLTAMLETPPQYGSLTLNTDGSFRYTPDLGFAGRDSFQYRAFDGELESDIAFVSIATDRLIITLGSNAAGTDITGQFTPFWTGELVGLNAALDPRGPQRHGIGAKTWTIPGEAVNGYTETLNLGQAEPLTNELKSLGHVDVYWITGGAKGVSLTANIGGIPSTKTTTIFISKPSGTITAFQDIVALLTIDGESNITLNPPKGITFERSASPTPDGNTFFRQTVVHDFHGIAPGDLRFIVDGNGTLSIDKSIVYPSIANTNIARDFPGINLTRSNTDHGIVRAYGQADFSMFVMWKSARPGHAANAISVPLQKLDWTFSFDVSLSMPAGVWVPTIPGNPPGEPRAPRQLSGIDWTELPEWDRLATGGDWQQED